MKSSGLFNPGSEEARTAFLKEWMLVKEDKPNSCYHFVDLLADL
jgi:hypothetical protein